MHRFPENKKFAFSIFDDTDLSTVENVSAVYRLLDELGFHTTKSVWPLASFDGARLGGATLQDPVYLDFVTHLRRRGFEIALHSVRNATATRQEVQQGLEEFRRLVGHFPRAHTNHCNNRDNVYWGASRFCTMASSFYTVAGTFIGSRVFEGDRDGSKYFWGDLCREHIDYVRNMIFREVNTLRINPSMPYHDPRKPFVKAWFSSSDGGDRTAFCNLLSESNQDRLEAEGGTCIVYTHFACGFSSDGRVHPRVEELLRRLARKEGWFVPVSQLLDFLRERRNSLSISPAEIATMERRWLADRVSNAARHVFLVLQFNGRTVKRAANSRSPRNFETQCKKRIVHITSAHRSSDVRIFYRECRSLARAGYEVLELTTEPADSHSDGIQIIGIGPNRGRFHRMTSNGLAIGREAIQLKADIYHVHDPDLLPLALLLRLLQKPVIYDIHEDLPRTFRYKHYIPGALRSVLMPVVEFMENLSARGMTGLIAATPAIAERFKPMNGRTEVISNFPDMNELLPVQSKPWNQRRQSVTYIGGITEERGIHELLGAMEKLHGQGATLEIAGWFSDPLLQRKLNVTRAWQDVVWRGLLDRNGIAELLGNVRAGLIVLHPEENFLTSQPTKMFEYMAAGIPVIASDFPLWRDFIDSTGCGILVDALDPQSIAGAISYVLTHDAEAEEMGRRGRAAVEQKFNWLAEERKLLAFYQSIVGATLNPRGITANEARS